MMYDIKVAFGASNFRTEVQAVWPDYVPINKHNVAFGRNFAGLHSRSDATQGLLLGEAFAIRFLREMKLTAREFFSGFSLAKFDGTRATV